MAALLAEESQSLFFCRLNVSESTYAENSSNPAGGEFLRHSKTVAAEARFVDAGCGTVLTGITDRSTDSCYVTF